MREWRRERAFSMEEAADLSGLHLSTLKDWITTVADLFVSERRAGRRWFSAEDILVLRIANELVKGGAVTLLALAVAWEHLADVAHVPRDAALAVKPGAIATSAVVLCPANDPPDWDAITIIKIGRIAEATYAACEAAYHA
ncbi:MerR family transcriptional regulator [Aquamicrobium lusatiense]|uniref:MerR family transcriptional regulator n=1 Tax=Aquamicrobium lusatiense TaxID=89772 RepID=UPI0024541C39|nr:MerR family transcriptional regulator [Aquamicrobium lusatiense]MDH4993314.1 MerR family transcriptional regulator [Aquamicrobium lusatiense]